MAPPSRWRNWKLGEDAPDLADAFAGFAGAVPSSIGETRRSREVWNQQYQQKGRTSPICDSPPHRQKASRTSRSDDDRAKRRTSEASERSAPPRVDPLDRIAELCVRHHLGQYDETSVGRRLAHLFAQRLDQLDQTTRALRAACDFLQIDGSQLNALNAETDRRSYGRKPGCDKSMPAEVRLYPY